MNQQGSITIRLKNRLGIGLAFGFIVIIALLLIGDIQKIGSRIVTFRWHYVPLILILTLSNYALRFVKWHYYIKLIGVKSITWQNSLRIFVAGFPLAVTPGKVGEAIKGVWLNNVSNAPIAKGVSVVVAERLSDGIAVLILSILGVIAYPQYWPGFVTIATLLLGIVILSQIRPLAFSVIHLMEGLPLLNRFTPAILQFYEGSYTLFSPRAIVIAVGLGTISWLGEGIGYYFVLTGLGIPPTTDTLFIAVFILAFSTIIGAVSTLPGGIGAAEASITGMTTLLLQVSTDIATTATLIIRFATLWFGVALGLLTWLVSKELLGFRTPEDITSSG